MSDIPGALNSVYNQKPMYFWQRRQPPSALEIAVADLQECRRDQMEQARLWEYHGAMLHMLQERDERLQADIKRLSRPLVDEDAPTVVVLPCEGDKG
jgi:hypothetical protein